MTLACQPCGLMPAFSLANLYLHSPPRPQLSDVTAGACCLLLLLRVTYAQYCPSAITLAKKQQAKPRTHSLYGYTTCWPAAPPSLLARTARLRICRRDDTTVASVWHQAAAEALVVVNIVPGVAAWPGPFDAARTLAFTHYRRGGLWRTLADAYSLPRRACPPRGSWPGL